MLVLYFLSALTVDKPSGVHYGVVGEAFVLTCTADAGLSNPTYKWFDKDGEMNSETLETLTITGATDKDGDYQCTATDDASKATAKSAKTNVEFKSKSFFIHHLKDKYGDL